MSNINKEILRNYVNEQISLHFIKINYNNPHFRGERS